MIGVGQIAQVILSLQSREMELRGVGEKILVAGGVDEELRHRQVITIRIGVFDADQRRKLRRARPPR